MSWFSLLLLLVPLMAGRRRLARLVQCRRADDAQRLYRRLALALGSIVLLSMAAQEALLLEGGLLNWATGLPLHLCSLMGLLLLPALLTRRDALLHTLLYAGVPGAGLALLFPSVARTPAPMWMAFFFCVMHAGIVLAPLLPMAMGWRPRPRGAGQALLFLLLAGSAAALANRLTGGNYIFLSGPVAGTPLMALSHWGQSVYRALLAALAALTLLAGAVIVHLRRRKGEN